MEGTVDPRSSGQDRPDPADSAPGGAREAGDTYFGGRDIAPQPNAEDAAFWAHCAQRRLTFQQCADCMAVTHPPIGACPRCQSIRRRWVEAPGRAVVFSYTWVHTAAHDAIGRPLPYNVVVVTFEGLAGVRLISNVVDAGADELRIGAELELVWQPIGETMSLPRFRLLR